MAVSRAHVSYDQRPTRTHAFAGVDVTAPVAGFYRTKLRSGGALVGVHIWFGPPHDPLTGEEMDRSHRWQAHINGDYVDFDDVWPRCAGEPISEGDYRRFCSRSRWAQDHAPNSAYADPMKRIDLFSADNPLPF